MVFTSKESIVGTPFCCIGESGVSGFFQSFDGQISLRHNTVDDSENALYCSKIPKNSLELNTSDELRTLTNCIAIFWFNKTPSLALSRECAVDQLTLTDPTFFSTSLAALVTVETFVDC